VLAALLQQHQPQPQHQLHQEQQQQHQQQQHQQLHQQSRTVTAGPIQLAGPGLQAAQVEAQLLLDWAQVPAALDPAFGGRLADADVVRAGRGRMNLRALRKRVQVGMVADGQRESGVTEASGMWECSEGWQGHEPQSPAQEGAGGQGVKGRHGGRARGEDGLRDGEGDGGRARGDERCRDGGGGREGGELEDWRRRGEGWQGVH
jgi:hypothetical protein